MNQDNNQNGPALSKRLIISKTQQETLLITIVAAVILGICGVLIVYFAKYINFNNKVIDAKDQAIEDYQETIKNIGLCRGGKNGELSNEDLEKCKPDALDSSTMPGTLRYNVLVDMANNTDLESVALSSKSGCYDKDEKINWQQRFDNSTDDSEKAEAIAMLKLCSALRVVPDALPAQQNDLALMSSINKIFILSNHEPESLSPSGSAYSAGTGLSSIPVSLSVEANAKTTMTVLNNLEKSIRTIDLQSARIEWSGNNFLALKSQGVAYYTENADVVETNKTVTAKSKVRRNNK